jgi:drug/metabolite transporter (DMT)-like permease
MALEIKTASELGVYLYFIPVISTIVSYVLFDDALTPFFFLGGFLVIAGLIVVNKYSIKNNTT